MFRLTAVVLLLPLLVARAGDDPGAHRQHRLYELELAAKARDLRRMADVLKEDPSLVNARSDEGGPTLLEQSARWGTRDVADFLLARGAKLDITAAAGLGMEKQVAAFLVADPKQVEAKNGQQQTPLYLAAHHGHTGVVRLLLARGADLKAKDGNGDTPLYAAAERGRSTAAELLLAAGADVEVGRPGYSPLFLAAGLGYSSVVRVLLKYKADPNMPAESGETPLLLVASRWPLAGFCAPVEWRRQRADQTTADWDRPEPFSPPGEKADYPAVVRLLLAHGAKPEVKDDGLTPLGRALHAGKQEIAEILFAHGAEATVFEAAALGKLGRVLPRLGGGEDGVDPEDEEGKTPLHWAARYGRTDVAAWLVAHGAKVDALDGDRKTPLVYAVQNGHPHMVALLSAANANLGMRFGGATYLHLGARAWNRDVVRLLLGGGPNVLAQDSKGRTALHHAVREGDTEVVRLLLTRDPLIDRRNRWGRTPLHEAAAHGFRDVVEALLARGANVNARDNDGVTPLHLAAYYGQKGATAALLAGGADPGTRNLDGLTPLRYAAMSPYGGLFACVNGMDLSEVVIPEETRDGEAVTKLIRVRLAEGQGK